MPMTGSLCGCCGAGNATGWRQQQLSRGAWGLGWPGSRPACLGHGGPCPARPFPSSASPRLASRVVVAPPQPGLSTCCPGHPAPPHHAIPLWHRQPFTGAMPRRAARRDPHGDQDPQGRGRADQGSLRRCGEEQGRGGSQWQGRPACLACLAPPPRLAFPFLFLLPAPGLRHHQLQLQRYCNSSARSLCLPFSEWFGPWS